MLEANLPCEENLGHSVEAMNICSERAKPWVLAATIIGSSLAFIVGSAVSVAAPVIQKNLNATAPEIQWVVNSFLLFMGALILTGGSVGDIFGRKRAFVVGTIIFTGASVWCGFSSDITGLIIARGVQGIGAALLVPNSLAIISASFDEKSRGKAIGTWAGFSALTTAVGPVLGGWLVDAFSWQWAFFIVVPPAIITIAIALWRVPESRDKEAQKLDLVGMALATLGLGGATYGLIASSARGWLDPLVLFAIVGSLVILTLFLFWESKAPNPMMPLSLFRSSSFSGANLVTMLLYFALTGILFFLPFNLIQVQDYTTSEAGAALLPFTVLIGGLSRWSGTLAEKFGTRFLLTIGPIIVALGMVLLALPGIGGSYWVTFFPALMVIGFGMALSVAPLTTIVMGSVKERYIGTASGVNTTVARVAGLLAIAGIGVVVLSVFSTDLEERLNQIDGQSLSVAARTAILDQKTELAEIQIPDEILPETGQMIEGEINLAFVESFRWAMIISAILAFLSGLVSRFTLPKKIIEPVAVS